MSRMLHETEARHQYEADMLGASGRESLVQESTQKMDQALTSP